MFTFIHGLNISSLYRCCWQTFLVSWLQIAAAFPR